MKTRIMRAFAAFALAVAMSLPALALPSDCPRVWISYDGGCTWSACTLDGATWDNYSTNCYYIC
jgi:hypothetical protein